MYCLFVVVVVVVVVLFFLSEILLKYFTGILTISKLLTDVCTGNQNIKQIVNRCVYQ